MPLRPSEMIELLLDLLGPEGTLAMPAFPIDQNPDKVFMVDRAPVYTGLLCEVFRRLPDVRRSIHLGASVCAFGPQADFLVRDHHLTRLPWAALPGQRLRRIASRCPAPRFGAASHPHIERGRQLCCRSPEESVVMRAQRFCNVVEASRAREISPGVLGGRRTWVERDRGCGTRVDRRRHRPVRCSPCANRSA